MPDLVDARWQGPHRGRLPDGTDLVPGETVVQVPRAEAMESDHWEVVERELEAPSPPAAAGAQQQPAL